MDTVSQFIDKLGGTVAVANGLDLAPTTVSSWKTSNSIPKWREPALRELAAAQGVEYPDRRPSRHHRDEAA
ncbi:hypothetical protein NCF86_03555 [Pelagerythrobacter marinus]|nr:hypothetical protein NCF86_03555 [Pelagerythrobacter marinus]